MHKHRKLISTILTVLATVSLFLILAYPAYAQADDAQTKLQTADLKLKQAFDEILKAEEAGANVTSLLDQVNVAADLLAKAEIAYQTGDSNTVSANTASIMPIAQQVTTSAQTARETAISSAQTSLYTIVGLSVAGCFVFIASLFLVWQWLKRRYVGNLLEAKPEVTVQ
jgi:predicted PurR-regulated permease PerM